MNTGAPLEGIAVVGLAGRFPGARSPAELWKNLCDGVESITFFDDAELIAAGVDPALVRAENYVKARGTLGDAEMIDAAFFGLNPREAALMDPQHRVFLECAWEALEGAGYSPDHQPGRVGVFGGMSMNTYLLSNVYEHIAHVASVESLEAAIGNDKDSLTTEVAYRLNLRGPAVTVQSSSSTSLVVIHYACQSLLNFECDMALAGGVSIHFPEKAGYLYYEGGTTAPDGHCRTFDARAKGFVAGHGAGVVVLKRLADAIACGDTIYAVVKGSAVNNDGSLKVSYMAPSVEGQAEVVALAQAVAGVTPDTIGYVEAHGTATPMGDPIEVAALTQAFRDGTDRERFCALGSIKTNIGHLDAAAGVAGFIKATLALHHRRIPASLHFEQPNPAIDLDHSPFYVNTQLAEWPAGDTPRRAGVTSLGMGGTNAHVILEEAPPPAAAEPARRRAQLLVLSARSDTALEAATERLYAHVSEHPDLFLADVAHTLQVGRRHFGKRRALVCQGIEDAATALATRDPARVLDGVAESAGRPIVFMFPGQGAQYVDMGRGLYDTEPAFRAEVDACANALEGSLGLDLRSVLYPPADQRDEAAARLRETALTQPALFVIEYALARLWMSWGVVPHAMIGHSIGEYVAACIAGVFTLEDALKLVAARGRLMQQMATGAMLGVPLSEVEIAPLLGVQLSLAAVNSARTSVVAGPVAAVDAFAAELAARGVHSTRVHTSHAFHSAMMDPILGPFCAEVARVTHRPPRIPYLSNLTGTWIKAGDVERADYWALHLRRTVRFSDGLGELLKDADAVLLEVGPGQTLANLAQQHPARGAQHVTLPSLRHARGTEADEELILRSLGRLWIAGIEPDWAMFHGGETRRRLPLPTYPFERQRHWVEPKVRTSGLHEGGPPDQKLGVDRWLYLSSWRRTPALPAAELGKGKACFWIFVTDPRGHDGGLGARLAQRLREADQEVVIITPGQMLAELAPRHWSIDPSEAADYAALVERLTGAGLAPDHAIHLWHAGAVAGTDAAAFDRAQDLGFFSLLYLAQALGASRAGKPLSLMIVTNHMQAIGEELPRPELATVLGPCRVIPQEHPAISCKAVDVSLPPEGSWRHELLIDRILAECVPAAQEPVVAYRGGERWVQAFEGLGEGAESGSGGLPLRDRGVYLVLGGLGNLGFSHAQVLARRVRARLVLVGRSVLPERHRWDAWLASHDASDPTHRKILKVQALEALGAQVLVAAADVADPAELRAVIDAAAARFDGLHGVVFAAGTVDQSLFCTVKDTTRALARAHFSTRAAGLYALEEALAGRPLDFCLLDGSLASILGGLGRSAYAAATSFMDAFALRQSRVSPVPWRSVGWDAWQLEAGADATLRHADPFGALAVTPEEGAEAFERVLALRGVSQVAVSTTPLRDRIARALRAEPPAEAGGEERAATRAQRGALQNAYVAPRDELEAAIAGVWGATLGLAEVGVYDNFFDLGGNSLVGVKMIDRLREQFQVTISAITLYERPTVEALAKLIKAAGTGAAAEEQPELQEGQDRGERRRERQQRRRRPAGSSGEP